MQKLNDALTLHALGEHDADRIVAISTGAVANKRSFVVESLARRRVVGASVKEHVVGYVIWDRAFFGRPFMWLLGVDSAFRRRGIAAQLIGDFERQNNGESLFTSTNESNQPMHALLTRAGFVRSGCVENLDPGDPEIFYFKDRSLGSA